MHNKLNNLLNLFAVNKHGIKKLGCCFLEPWCYVAVCIESYLDAGMT